MKTKDLSSANTLDLRQVSLGTGKRCPKTSVLTLYRRVCFKSDAFLYPPGPGCSKPVLANPGLARILFSVLKFFGEVFCLYCLPFSFKL